MRRLSPAERVVASYNRGRIFTYQGLYDEALRQLEDVTAADRDHPLIKTFAPRSCSIAVST
jgi:hypothetical protein